MPYTLAELRTRTRDVLNETTAAFWTDLEIDRFLNDAAADISGIVKCVEATTTVTMAENTRDYGLPSDAIEVRHAQEELTGRGLIKITPTSAGHHSAVTTDEDPLRWYEFATRFYIEPIPDATMAGKSIRLFYVVVTQDITDIPETVQLAALDYALYRAKQKDRQFDQAFAIHAAYLNNLVVRRNDIYQRDPHTLSDIRIAEVAVNG